MVTNTRVPMPWSFKAVVAAFGVAAIGGTLIFFACVVGRWESISYFVYGLIISAIGLFGALLFSIVCAATRPTWRKRSLFTVGLSILLAFGLFFFAKTA